MATLYKDYLAQGNQPGIPQSITDVSNATRNNTRELNEAWFGNSLSLEDWVSQLKGGTGQAGPVFDPTKGPQINFGQGNVPYTGSTNPKDYGVSPQQNISQNYTVKPGDTVSAIAKQFGVPMSAVSGYGADINKIQPGQTLSVNNSSYQKGLQILGNTQVPQNPAEALHQVSQALPVTGQQEPQIATQLMQTDPVLQQMQQQFQQYMSSANQQQTLTQQYQDLLASTGLQGINTQLVNMQNVMNGTEDDIRTEVQKTGGFATDSQVQALTVARNKVLVQNYNNLLNQRNSIQDQINTMMSLSQQDRQLASQQFDRMMNFEGKILDYGMKMQDNARQAYADIGKTYGYGALMTGDSNADSRTEQIMGIPQGSLQQLAAIDEKKRAAADLKTSLETRKLVAETTKAEAEAGIGGGVITGAKNIQQLSTVESQIQAVNSLISDSNLADSVGPNPLARMSFTNWLTGGKSNFIAGIEQLRSSLNLDALIKAKGQGATFGALSDQELKVLASSATKMGTWAIKDASGNITGYNANETDFKNELEKVNNAAKLDYVLKGGDPDLIGLTVTPDGHLWSQNWDGTMTQVK